MLPSAVKYKILFTHPQGHTINLGVQVFSIVKAVAKSEVNLIAIPPTAILPIIEQMGDVPGKTIIDATNAVRQAKKSHPK